MHVASFDRESRDFSSRAGPRAGPRLQRMRTRRLRSSVLRAVRAQPATGRVKLILQGQRTAANVRQSVELHLLA